MKNLHQSPCGKIFKMIGGAFPVTQTVEDAPFHKFRSPEIQSDCGEIGMWQRWRKKSIPTYFRLVAARYSTSHIKSVSSSCPSDLCRCSYLCPPDEKVNKISLSRLSSSSRPVLIVLAYHNYWSFSSKHASEDEAEGLEVKIILMKGLRWCWIII